MRYKIWILGLSFFILPPLAHAALVNINTADAVTLDSLPGIGSTKAHAIVDYRSANGLFATIEDIKNVSGIGPSTFAEIKPFITVGDTSAAPDPNTSNSATLASQDTSTPAQGAPTYVPPPTSIALHIHAAGSALVEVPLTLAVSVEMKHGVADTVARVRWSFGDGSSSEGRTVTKLYHYAGTYLVVATASDGSATARDEVTVVVKSSSVRIAAVSGEGITLANDSGEELDLSDWRITSSKGAFRLPIGTALLPQSSVLFPFTIMNMPIAFDATLTYPDGVTATRYAPPVVVATATRLGAAPAQTLLSEPIAQPTRHVVGYKQVQGRAPVVHTNVVSANLVTHDENTAALAPATATNITVAGALFAHATTAPHGVAVATAMAPANHSFFTSPFALSLLGVLFTSGVALAIL